MISKILFTFFIICAFSGVKNDYVPFLSYLNSDTNLQINNKITVGQSVLFDTISNKLKSTTNVLVILLDQLDEQNLNHLLRKSTLKNVDYFPLIENPDQSLNEFSKQNPSVNIKIINSNDINDAFFMFMEKMSNSNSVILTGKSSVSTKLRAKRQASTNPNIASSNVTYYAFGTQCAASFMGASFIDTTVSLQANQVSLVILDSSSFSCDNINGTASLTINFDASAKIADSPVQKINLLFANNGLYWIFSNGTLTTQSKTYGLSYLEAPYSMETPNNYSFVCTRTHYRLYDLASPTKAFVKVDFYINYFQVQPFNIVPTGSNYTFGKINYCQGFFSNGIWMAITASLLLTFILAFGVSLLFSIKTMDRFDDPKGKPLNIAMEK